MDPRNPAELQSPYINIFQVLTCTRHYTDYPLSAKANGAAGSGREESEPWRPFLKWQAFGLKPLPRELRRRFYFLDIKKLEGTVSFQHFAKSGRILDKS